MLLTIMKIQNATTAITPGYDPSPRVSPIPPHRHHIFQQQQQQPQKLTVSPLPPTGESNLIRWLNVVDDSNLGYFLCVSE